MTLFVSPSMYSLRIVLLFVLLNLGFFKKKKVCWALIRRLRPKEKKSRVLSRDCLHRFDIWEENVRV